MKINRIRYNIWWFKRGLRIICQRLLKKNFKNINRVGNRKLLKPQKGNDYISDLIKSDKPFMVARFGSTEMDTINKYIRKKLGYTKDYKKSAYDYMNINAGFFPADDMSAMDKFAELLLEDCKQVDLLGMFATREEDFVVQEFMAYSKLTYLRGLEPYYYDNPWSENLKGKKVLVIHPFEKSIKNQYKIKEKLFQDMRVLPDFELLTLKAVQTVGGQKSEFKTWFDALNYMAEEALKKDFDIAIIGCGAYGFPLAAKLKKAGKQAIHLGGSTQILFGIKGSRWHKGVPAHKYFNEYWTSPNDDEKVENSKKVEGNAYW